VDSVEQVRRGEIVEVTETFWDGLSREVDARVSRGHVPNPDACP